MQRMNPKAVDINALVLGQNGVGKSSIIQQISAVRADFLHKDEFGVVHSFLEFSDHNVHLQLMEASSSNEINAEDYQVALLCFDLTSPASIDVLLDQINALMKVNNRIFFALLGNKRDRLSEQAQQSFFAKEMKNKMEVLTESLGELYSYNFMGIYFNATQDGRYNQAPYLISILCEKYIAIMAKEKVLTETFLDTYEKTDDHPLARRNVSKENPNFDVIIHNAARTDVFPTRSCSVFQALGWFDKHGKTQQTTPKLIQQRLQSMERAGISRTEKVGPEVLRRG